MAEDPPPQQPSIPGIPGVAAAQAGPLATIAAIVVAAVMQQYTANSNHTTTNDDLEKVKTSQTEMSSKLSALNDQLGQITALKSTQSQQDSRMTTAEQGIIQLQADLKRDELLMKRKNAQPASTPYVPYVQPNTAPQAPSNEPPKHR
jgi:hypothetical protein